MAENGDVSISTLKEATGINDNRLSAHNPEGAETKFEDFFVDAVGDVQDDNSVELGIAFVEHLGGKDLTDQWQKGEEVILRWECKGVEGTNHDDRGAFFIRQCCFGQQSFTLTLNDFGLLDERDKPSADGLATVREYRMKLEITGYDSVLAAIRFDADNGFNGDATGHDSNVSSGRHEFFYNDVRSSKPEIEDVDHQQLSCDNAEYEVKYDVRYLWDPEDKVGTEELFWEFDDGLTDTTTEGGSSNHRENNHIYESPNDGASTDITLRDADDGTEYDTYTYTYTRKENNC